MDSGIILRTIRTTLLGSGFLFPFLAQKFPPAIAWGFLLGALLSALNFYLLSRLFQIVLQNRVEAGEAKRSFQEWVSALCRLKTDLNPRYAVYREAFLKIPCFYALLFFLVYGLNLSPYATILGFTFPLAIVVLKEGGWVLELKKWGALQHKLR